MNQGSDLAIAAAPTILGPCQNDEPPVEIAASRTLPDGDWEKVQRAAIDAWAQAHKLAADHGKAVSG